MKNFAYQTASSLAEAAMLAREPGTQLIAGGTTLLDLAKCGVAEPQRVIDIGRLDGLSAIDVGRDGVRIGALATMAAVADHPAMREAYPAVVQSLSLAASAQLRNMATIGGNLLQRTRCAYFRDPATFPACNKRNPGSGCAAIGGVTRNHAVLGISDACIATYPGDLAIALVALGAEIHCGDRVIAAEDFFLEPGQTPECETRLELGELITHVAIAQAPAARNSIYLKVRDRQSYEFAAASAAVGMELAEDGRTIKDLRIALGGVATRPWRARNVEKALIGQPLDDLSVRAASRLAVEGARATADNAYKIELAPRVIARAILTLGGLA